jgi:hypothetical protein
MLSLVLEFLLGFLGPFPIVETKIRS